MKFSPVLALGLSALSVAAREQGLNKMELLKTLKVQQLEKMKAEGFFDKGKYGAVKAVTPCRGGKAGEFACDKVDLHSFLSHEQMGSTTREGNDVWGE